MIASPDNPLVYPAGADLIAKLKKNLRSTDLSGRIVPKCRFSACIQKADSQAKRERNRQPLLHFAGTYHSNKSQHL